jgi:CRISPR-associated protein Csm2
MAPTVPTDYGKGKGGHGSHQEGHSQTGGWGAHYANDLKDLAGLGAERIVEIAEAVGKRLSSRDVNLKINQIRRFLDEARQIEAETKKEKGGFPADRIILLLPKLAYAAGREGKIKDLMTVLDPAIRSASRSKDNFHKFLRLIEGIVAYHRFYGGTN